VTSDFSLAFVADAVHRRGGQERAAAEVLSRVARRIAVTVIARDCDLGDALVRWLPVHVPARPSVLRTWAFARAARVAERRAACTITNSIGAAALDADVITAQFCHAAFTARFGGIRGGSGVRAAYQHLAQAWFVAEERRAYRSARLKRVIAVSQGTARELSEFYGVPAELITVVPNGVDHAVFRPSGDDAVRRALRAQLGLPADEFLALFVGGDWERKGVRDAIAAIAGLADSRFVILGSGDREAMRVHAERAGAERQVIFAGPTRTPEDYYAACDAFLFPSRYEAFSLVTLEAAASGLPIIAHAINGTEELVRDGENGWLVPPGADALRSKLLILRDDTARRARMSAAAVASSRRYGWDRIAEEQFAVFSTAATEVVASTKRAPQTVELARPELERARRPMLRTLQLGMEWFPEKPGGLNRVYFELMRHLPDAGVEVHGLVAGSREIARSSHGMIEGFGPHSGALIPRLLAVRRIAAPLLRGDPGILVVSHFALYTAPVLDELRGHPLIVHFQGPWGLEGRAERQSPATVLMKTLVERAVYRRASAFIALSTPFAQILERRFHVPPERIHIIPGGVDVPRFAIAESRAECRVRLGWPADRPIVLAVRRLMRRMGLDDLIAAAVLVRERVPDLLVLIAGRGPVSGELEEQIRSLHLQEHVRLLGFVPDEDLPRAYRAADLTVVPSVALEGFGLIVAESFAAGTPCLVTPVGGLPEAVAALSRDLVLRATGAPAIADGLTAALTGALPLPDAKACIEFARRHYDWPVIAERIRLVYEQAMQ
jgi:glycosyltransferase involved in cell wall biosynthesis